MNEIIITFILSYFLLFIASLGPYIIIVGILLNMYNKLMYGKRTFLAFIPILRIYLIGKYAFSEFAGALILLGLIVGQGSSSIPVVNSLFNIILSLSSIFLLISIVVTIKNYFDLKKGKKPNAEELERQRQEKAKQELSNSAITTTYDASTMSLIERQELTQNNESVSQPNTPSLVNTQTNSNSVSDDTDKKQCPKCGTQIKKDVVICPFCGFSNSQNQM